MPRSTVGVSSLKASCKTSCSDESRVCVGLRGFSKAVPVLVAAARVCSDGGDELLGSARSATRGPPHTRSLHEVAVRQFDTALGAAVGESTGS